MVWPPLCLTIKVSWLLAGLYIRMAFVGFNQIAGMSELPYAYYPFDTLHSRVNINDNVLVLELLLLV